MTLGVVAVVGGGEGTATPRASWPARGSVHRGRRRAEAHAPECEVGQKPSSQCAFDCRFLQNFELGDIFSKYETCSVKCPLQLFQRAIGCLVKGLAGNVC
jgi:hypothetical protein